MVFLPLLLQDAQNSLVGLALYYNAADHQPEPPRERQLVLSVCKASVWLID